MPLSNAEKLARKAARKTARGLRVLNIWLPQEQIAWLDTKGKHRSEAISELIAEISGVPATAMKSTIGRPSHPREKQAERA